MKRIIFLFSIFLSVGTNLYAMADEKIKAPFPLPLDMYHDKTWHAVGKILLHRIHDVPMNLIATLLFLCAIIHTFLAPKLAKIAYKMEERHIANLATKTKNRYVDPLTDEVSFKVEMLHFFSEIEVVFSLWAILLLLIISLIYGLQGMVGYVNQINYTEPMFVVVIMSLAATRPILRLVEKFLRIISKLGKSTHRAWWFTILTVAPLLGSFITEPAAMTLAALLLAKQFYDYRPSPTFAYATLGLLFVNVSVGGTLSNFAAPPILMVARLWHWDIAFMFEHFGWKAFLGILFSNIIYGFVFRKEFGKLDKLEPHPPFPLDHEVIHWDHRDDPVPVIVTLLHILFIVWTVIMAHHPALFVGGFLLFIGFHKATLHHQNKLDLKSPMLVGFFLAGLVTHGKAQAWWLAPVIGNLNEITLMLGSTVLTAFNDNAAITYLSTLVPNFTESLKYAVVAGAVTGGGLTVIANAPNPAGQSILREYFGDHVEPLKLFFAALIPTIILGLSFLFL